MLQKLISQHSALQLEQLLEAVRPNQQEVCSGAINLIRPRLNLLDHSSVLKVAVVQALISQQQVELLGHPIFKLKQLQIRIHSLQVHLEAANHLVVQLVSQHQVGFKVLAVKASLPYLDNQLEVTRKTQG